MEMTSESTVDDHKNRQHLIKFSIAKIMSPDIPRRTRDSAFTRYIPQNNKGNSTFKNHQVTHCSMLMSQDLLNTKTYALNRCIYKINPRIF